MFNMPHTFLGHKRLKKKKKLRLVSHVQEKLWYTIESKSSARERDSCEAHQIAAEDIDLINFLKTRNTSDNVIKNCQV